MGNSIRQLLIPTFDANQDSSMWFDSSWYSDKKKEYIPLNEVSIEENENAQ